MDDTADRIPTTGPPDLAAPLRRVRTIARAMDRRFRVPGTSFRFGLDPLLGLFPVAGDVLTALASGYVIYVAWRAGAPARLLARMLANVGIDTFAGSVPVLGDLFDAGWKANVRNVALLERWLGVDPTAERPRPVALIGVVVTLGLLLAGVVALIWWVVASVV